MFMVSLTGFGVSSNSNRIINLVFSSSLALPSRSTPADLVRFWDFLVNAIVTVLFKLSDYKHINLPFLLGTLFTKIKVRDFWKRGWVDYFYSFMVWSIKKISELEVDRVRGSSDTRVCWLMSIGSGKLKGCKGGTWKSTGGLCPNKTWLVNVYTASRKFATNENRKKRFHGERIIVEEGYLEEIAVEDLTEEKRDVRQVAARGSIGWQ